MRKGFEVNGDYRLMEVQNLCTFLQTVQLW